MTLLLEPTGAAAVASDDRQATILPCWQRAVRGLLRCRWQRTRLAALVDDAAQDVFVECLRPGGALDRFDPARGDFATFLRGVVRHVADRIERQEARRRRGDRGGDGLADLAAADRSPPRRIDRSWARRRIAEATAMLAEEQHRRGPPRPSLVELLKLQFEDGLPLRAVAARLCLPAARAHALRRLACRRFRRCLERVLAAGAAGAAPTSSRVMLTLLQ